MNPLIVFFVISIILEDYFFRQGYYIKFLVYTIITYYIFYLFQHRSTFHSPSKKFNMAAYTQSFDPTIYARVLFDTEKAEKFLEEYNKKYPDKKFKMFHFWIKVVANVYESLPECNEVIRFGLKVKRNVVDIGIILNTQANKEFVDVVLRDVPNKTLVQVYDELESEIAKFRRERKEHGRKLYNYLPAL
mgnify:CR=1 FL=1